jgi:hypothetical protein
MKINKPDEAEVRVEHHNLYKGNSQKAVAAAAGISSTILSRRLDHNEAIVKNPIYEVIAEMIGAEESGQRSIGKGIFKMIYRYAEGLGLVDEQPLDILEMAYERLRSIEPNDIRAMSDAELTDSFASITDLENEASKVKGELTAERSMRRVMPRNAETTELGGRSRMGAFGRRG